MSEKILDPICRLQHRHSKSPLPPREKSTRCANKKVLILGIYLADKPNFASHLIDYYSKSTLYDVVQRWIGIGGKSADAAVMAVTHELIQGYHPRSMLLNRLLSADDWREYDFVIISDDDIAIQKGFLDAMLSYQEKYDFALAQPARTLNSHVDHAINRQCTSSVARRTRYVEIGPVVSIRRDLGCKLLPLDESSPMGWGLDYVWPVLAEAQGLRLGIIDATPVDHSMRRPRAGYAQQEALRAMNAFLAKTPSLAPAEAEVVLESYSR